MNILQYSLFAYGVTAAISYLVIALIVMINKIMSGKTADDNTDVEKGTATEVQQ